MSDKKFHLTITNNETGETIHECDAYAIIATISREETTDSLALVECNPFDLAHLLVGLESTVDELYQEHPELALLKQMLKTTNKETETDTTTETTEN
jgi:diadenosine tetraphosphate (Ap4A) HIT family hydrolase